MDEDIFLRSAKSLLTFITDQRSDLKLRPAFPGAPQTGSLRAKLGEQGPDSAVSVETLFDLFRSEIFVVSKMCVTY